jgi:uncharacterized protein
VACSAGELGLGWPEMHAFSNVRRMVILSDTHGLIRAGFAPELADADLILHAGDVGSAAVLAWLRGFAPTVAVRGNVDDADSGLAETEVVAVNGQFVYLLHQLERLDLNPKIAGMRVVASGHSHRACIRQTDGICFCNPGSIGPRRFRLPITLVRFALCPGGWDGTVRELVMADSLQGERIVSRTQFVVNLDA